jgi:hypothetical protein
MTRIVTTTYRYKRPSKKRNVVALEVPRSSPRPMIPIRTL